MLEGIRMIVLLVSLFLCAWIDWKTERVSVPLLLLGGMTAVLLHLFAQEESVFYLMTGMSVGIALLLYFQEAFPHLHIYKSHFRVCSPQYSLLLILPMPVVPSDG